jgi:hypothetical protein
VNQQQVFFTDTGRGKNIRTPDQFLLYQLISDPFEFHDIERTVSAFGVESSEIFASIDNFTTCFS